MILKFKDFINEASTPNVVMNTPQVQKDFIYFRNPIQKDLWDKMLVGQISDGKWENRRGSNWRFWANLVSGIDAQNPRVTKTTYDNASFNFSAKDLLDAVGDEMLQIAQVHNPDYTKRNLITDLNDISDICKSAASYSRTSGVAKAKRRLTTGFDEKDIMRIKDIVTKSQKPDKAGRDPLTIAKLLANKMAKAIDDGAKALRRAKAAESIGEEDLASIFYGRVADLNFGDQWRSSTTLRDINKKLGIFDDDFDLDDPEEAP